MKLIIQYRFFRYFIVLCLLTFNVFAQTQYSNLRECITKLNKFNSSEEINENSVLHFFEGKRGLQVIDFGTEHQADYLIQSKHNRTSVTNGKCQNEDISKSKNKFNVYDRISILIENDKSKVEKLGARQKKDFQSILELCSKAEESDFAAIFTKALESKISADESPTSPK